jgi:hypothetical protein
MRADSPLLLSGLLIACGAFGFAAGCSSSSSSGGGSLDGGVSTGGSTSGGSGGGLNLGGSGNGGGSGGGGGKITQAPDCPNSDPNVDKDGDGYTGATGDCNECTTQMNAGAFDYPANGIDEDCNGTPDDEPAGCDGSTVDIGYGDPVVAAQVLGICRMAQNGSWGLVSAAYVMADGTPGMNDLSHGLLPSFGPNVSPREGATMLALSSGTARAPGMPGFQSPELAMMGTFSSTPPGFPKDSPACSVATASDTTANNPAALELVIKAPSNANHMKFDFDFYTYEFPEYVCTAYNDFFVALVSPAPANAQDGNVSFDSQGNPVSVNNGFLEVCPAQTAGGKNFPCALGTAELQGTGFDELLRTGPHAATGWLNTQAPIAPGQQFTVRFAIWDMGDEILDSTVLVDNFGWDLKEGQSTPVTTPIPK